MSYHLIQILDNGHGFHIMSISNKRTKKKFKYWVMGGVPSLYVYDETIL